MSPLRGVRRCKVLSIVHILVTAGPTREYFDTVRFISNPSSGKMGYAIADQAFRMGHDVTLVSGPVSLETPKGVTRIDTVSAQEMLEACLDVYETSDAAIMTAAVCDYRPTRTLDHKLQKRHQPRRITLQPTTDIAACLGKIKGARVMIGFAMEDHDHHAHAEGKLRRKRCDAIILNGKDNVGTDHARVEILRSDLGWCGVVEGTKPKIARAVIKITLELSKLSDGVRGPW